MSGLPLTHTQAKSLAPLFSRFKNEGKGGQRKNLSSYQGTEEGIHDEGKEEQEVLIDYERFLSWCTPSFVPVEEVEMKLRRTLAQMAEATNRKAVEVSERERTVGNGRVGRDAFSSEKVGRFRVRPMDRACTYVCMYMCVYPRFGLGFNAAVVLDQGRVYGFVFS